VRRIVRYVNTVTATRMRVRGDVAGVVKLR
jgi:hypothetical protein